MQKLRSNAGAQAVDRALRFLGIRLRSRPETQELASPVDEARARVRAADDAWQQAREERVAASAEVAYRDEVLDATMARLVREVLVLTGGRYDDERYRRLFPSAPSTVMRQLASAGQSRYVRTVMAILQETPELEEMRGHVGGLQEALAGLDDALAKRDSLYVPEAQALAERRVALDVARRLFEQTYFELRLRLPRRTALVESFFPDLRGASASRGTGDAAASEPAEEGAAGDAVE
jgi:hypothetical protein